MNQFPETRDGSSADLDALFLFGGAAFILFGAGLLLSNRTVRRYLGQQETGDLLQAVLPDVERYLRLRSM